jgi:hypothetical protein
MALAKDEEEWNWGHGESSFCHKVCKRNQAETRRAKEAQAETNDVSVSLGLDWGKERK